MQLRKLNTGAVGTILWSGLNRVAAVALLVVLYGCSGGDQSEAQKKTVSTAKQGSKGAEKAQSRAPRKRRQVHRLGNVVLPKEADWEPENYDLPDPATDINLALQQAKNALNKGRLVEPADKSALGLLLSVLQRDPANQQALSSLASLGDTLLKRANTDLDQGKIREAIKFANGLALIKPAPRGIPALQARLKQARRVTRLLAAASEAVDADHLVAPVENNALYFYRQILALKASDGAAVKGLKYVEEQLLKRSRAAAKERKFDNARRWLSMAADVRENSSQVLRVKAEIDDLQSVATEQAADRVRVALKAADVPSAKSALADLQKVSPPASLLQTLTEKVRILDVYGSFAPGETFSDPATEGLKHPPRMVVIPAGDFTMGSAQDEIGRSDAEGPQRSIHIGNPWAMMRTETSVAEFGDFIVATGYRTDAERLGDSITFNDGRNAFEDNNDVNWKNTYDGKRARPDDPVLHVSWNDATRYAAWVSKETGFHYALPSEAEFEYALRAGTTTRFWWGNGGPPEVVENTSGSRDRSENFNTWEGAFYGYGDKYWGIAPVGSFKPNPFGLMDMAGNASEWVADCWFENLTRIPANGSAYSARGCKRRVLRGGAYASNPQEVRSAFRRSVRPQLRHARVGFRLMRSLDAVRVAAGR